VRVTLVGSYYAPFVGGIETHMAQLAGALRDAGVEVTVSCLLDPPRISPPVEELLDGIVVRRAGSRNWRKTVVWPQRLLPSDSVDIVHFHGFSRPLLVRCWLDSHGAPMVITPHSGIKGIVTDSVMMRRFAKAVFDRTVGRVLLQRAFQIIALTDAEANHLHRYLGIERSQITVMPNPLADNAFQLQAVDQGSSGRLIVLSRLSAAKRIGDLITALRMVSFPIACDIAGPDGGEEQRLRQLAAQLTPKAVRFIGPISGEVKARALRSAKALVLASSSEGLSISALEAIAQGTPVIASDSASAGLPEAACLTYPVGDTKALAERIDSLTQPSVLSALQEGAIRARESILRVADQGRLTIKIYQKALGTVAAR
jgi:glycosyltransferase involved in cell wall biosynthesis